MKPFFVFWLKKTHTHTQEVRMCYLFPEELERMIIRSIKIKLFTTIPEQQSQIFFSVGRIHS